MKFLYPTFLWALFALAIPLIIHFFNFRRYKTVYFSNVGFLKEIKKESKKKSRLKQILLLIARLLTLFFLIFAFAQPYLPIEKNVRRNPIQQVAIYVDNSFSMNALSEDGQLLEVARNKAVEICLAHPAGTKFRLFTNDLDPRHQHLLSKEQFIQEVSEINTSPIMFPLSQIYNRYALDSENAEEIDKNLYFISDFQRNLIDLDEFQTKNIFTYFVPLQANKPANLFIDSCWVDVPAHRLNQEEKLYVKIKNSSDQAYQNLPLTLYINDSVKSITNFSIEPNNEITAELQFKNNTSGIQAGRVEISDYPFTHDNTWYLSYFVKPQLSALVLFENTPSSLQAERFISSLFINDDFIVSEKMNIQSVQMSKFYNYNTIFLSNLSNLSSGLVNQLDEVCRNGVSVVLFPESGNSFLHNNNLLQKLGANSIISNDTVSLKISEIDFENDFYRDVFDKQEVNPVLPEIKSHYIFEKNIRIPEIALLKFQNQSKALSVLKVENGSFWVFSFPLNKKNESFARDVLFVPTLYNIVLSSVPVQRISNSVGKAVFYEITKDRNLNLNEQIQVLNQKNQETFVPEKTITGKGTRLLIGDNIKEAGHYQIKNDDKIITTLAFNYDRNESELSFYNVNELQALADENTVINLTIISNPRAEFSEILDELQNGKALWKWCLVLALIFIATEVFIARFMK